MVRRKGHRSRGYPGKKGNVGFGRKFLFWGIVYVILFNILFALFENTGLFQAKVGFSLVVGYILIIASRGIYSAYFKKKFSMRGVVIWGLVYALAFGLISFILSKFPQIQVNAGIDKYLNIILFALLFAVVIIFLRRMKIDTKSRRRGPILTRAPSQILSGVALLVAGFLTFRFSYKIFVVWFNWPEGMAWSWLIGLGLLIAGLLTLVAWWRNNVSMFTSRHSVNWRTR